MPANELLLYYYEYEDRHKAAGGSGGVVVVSLHGEGGSARLFRMCTWLDVCARVFPDGAAAAARRARDRDRPRPTDGPAETDVLSVSRIEEDISERVPYVPFNAHNAFLIGWLRSLNR